MVLLDGRYRLDARLGRGGTADVFAASDLRLGRRVAVKTLTPGLGDPHARERFEREARSLSSFVHPNAVAVFDAGVHDDQPYLVMELVDGPTLAARLAADGPLPVGEAVAIADQVLAALDSAHRRGLVHRDVKPSNILLGADGRVRLADFGIAKSVSDLTGDLTATGQVIGTASYLAPELAHGERATPASDLYSLGIVLFETLTGDVPLRGESPLETLTARDHSSPPPLRSRRADVPPALDAAVARALDRDPGRRFPSAAAMRSALATDGEPPTVPVGAEPTATFDGAGGRRGSRRRRHTRRPVAPFLACLVVLGVVVGAVVAVAPAGGHGRAATPPATTRRSDPPATSAPTSTAPTTTTTLPRPTSVAGLLALLDTPDARYGPMQAVLRRRLQTLVGRKSGPLAKESAALVRDVTRWAATGGLDPVVASDAIRLLSARAAPVPPRRHGGRATVRSGDAPD